MESIGQCVIYRSLTRISTIQDAYAWRVLNWIFESAITLYHEDA